MAVSIAEVVEAFVVVVLAALAASVSVVLVLASVLAVSVSFNCSGSLNCFAPINFLKEKINFVNQKCPCVVYVGHFLYLRKYIHFRFV
ncbi:hypothetical protein V7083_15405 [Bacillus sp. JJ1764]